MTGGETPPELPEGMEDMGTPPELPEGMEDMGTPPELPEGMEDMGTPPGMQQMANTTDTTGTASAGISLSELSTDAKAEIGVSALVMAAGIVAAAMYTRRKN